MLKLFSRKPHQTAPQYAAAQRLALAVPGGVPERLPYATYDRMEEDPMIQTALTLKKLGVLAAKYAIESEDAERAAFVVEAFERMEGSPRSILTQAMDAFAKGWSVQELVWLEDQGRLWLHSVRPKDPSRFGLDVDPYGRVTGLTLQLPGEPPRNLDRENFVLYANRAGYGRLRGRSDLDAAWRHWVMKGQLMSDWKLHMARFAMPTVVGTVKRGAPQSEVDHLLSLLENLAGSTAIVVPDESTITTLGGEKEASTGFQEAIEFHNREIARSILGQTLTTDEGRRVGSLALGKVHLQVLIVQLDALRRELADLVMTEQVIRPLIEANFGPGPIPRLVFETGDLGLFASGELGAA